MVRNQASAARRQRERDRQQKRQEKLAERKARRQEKAESTTPQVDDPMKDPTVDWSDAVREIKLDPNDPEYREAVASLADPSLPER